MVRYANILGRAVLASQAEVGIDAVELALGLDPVEVDVGCGQAGESAEADEGCFHYKVLSRRVPVSEMKV
jgi:hypothetical protein